MSKIQVGPDHIIGDVIHTRILRETTETNPEKAFFAEINVPGFDTQMPITNGAAHDYHLPSVPGLPVSPTIHVEVDDFTLAPPGNKPTAVSFKLVFKLVEFFRITLGSIPVTANLQAEK